MHILLLPSIGQRVGLSPSCSACSSFSKETFDVGKLSSYFQKIMCVNTAKFVKETLLAFRNLKHVNRIKWNIWLRNLK